MSKIEDIVAAGVVQDKIKGIAGDGPFLVISLAALAALPALQDTPAKQTRQRSEVEEKTEALTALLSSKGKPVGDTGTLRLSVAQVAKAGVASETSAGNNSAWSGTQVLARAAFALSPPRKGRLHFEQGTDADGEPTSIAVLHFSLLSAEEIAAFGQSRRKATESATEPAAQPTEPASQATEPAPLVD